MKISIIGTGYVGLITGVCFAELGNNVICIDINEEKVNKINSGEPTIYERGLEEIFKKNLERIKASLNFNEILNTDITFICVSTPENPDGSINLDYIKSASESVGKVLKEKGYHLVVVKSTVVPETTEKVVIPILEKFSEKNVGEDFGVCMNPEFLKEGSAIKDFMEPDRIVIGEFDKKSGDMLFNLYKDFKCPILRTDLKTAEMIKYASNAFLSMKISFINEMGNICKKLGINIYKVAEGMGYDERIGHKFLRAGPGFGGSCFKKDVNALIKKAESLGYEPKILKSVLEVNERQPLKMIELLKKYLQNLKNKKIGVLGLSFKPETDDIRESPAIKIVKKLLEEEAIVNAYDPKAMNNFKKLFPNINYFSSAQDCIENSEAVLIVTDWDEFKDLDYSDKIVIDGRYIISKEKAKIYEGICW